jgi:hypothetical protein
MLQCRALRSCLGTLTNVARSARSAESRSFSLSGLPIGHYILTVRKDSFADATQELTLVAGTTADVKIQLKQFNQNLPELVLLEAIQQLVMKREEPLSPSLFTFRSRLTAVHHHQHYVFMTAGCRLLRTNRFLSWLDGS